MPRKYQKTKDLLPEIEEMIGTGMSQREIEEVLGLEGDRPVHNLLKRKRRIEKQPITEQRGRKPAVTIQEYKYENKRLNMENELLRDFLRAVGRR
jgi:predicted DNA-binding ArsR family transcriptional regulator